MERAFATRKKMVDVTSLTRYVDIVRVLSKTADRIAALRRVRGSSMGRQSNRSIRHSPGDGGNRGHAGGVQANRPDYIPVSHRKGKPRCLCRRVRGQPYGRADGDTAGNILTETARVCVVARRRSYDTGSLRPRNRTAPSDRGGVSVTPLPSVHEGVKSAT